MLDAVTYTPGPWVFKILKYGWTLVNEAGRKVDISPHSADGRLLCQAPAMLEALENSNIELRATLESGGFFSTVNRAMLRARIDANSAVIAKAKGDL